MNIECAPLEFGTGICSLWVEGNEKGVGGEVVRGSGRREGSKMAERGGSYTAPAEQLLVYVSEFHVLVLLP